MAHIITAIKLFQKKKKEQVKKIEAQNLYNDKPVQYLINNKWIADISKNSVEKHQPNPTWYNC